MLAVFKREFLSYFKNPTGYVAIALYSFLAGYIFVNKFAGGTVNLSSEIISMRSYFLIIVPIITMGLFAEDKRRGTDIIYYTSPVSIFNVVLGKFLAAMSLFFIMFLNVFAHMFVTAVLLMSVHGDRLSYISSLRHCSYRSVYSHLRSQTHRSSLLS